MRNSISKQEIREKIWRLMEEKNIAKFPRPVYGRIPNFKGNIIAASKFIKHILFRNAKIIFCNPDSPQRPIREAVLKYRKTLVMATPRLREGFIIIEPGYVPRGREYAASTIRGAFKYGKTVDKLSFKIDVKVTGCVAVSKDGGRVGKGGGYSDLEYALLREMHAIDESTPIVTTVHDIQIVDYIPMTEHDMPVDFIFTPTQIIEVKPRRKRPPGIIWSELDPRKMEEIPILKKYCYNKLK